MWSDFWDPLKSFDCFDTEYEASLLSAGTPLETSVQLPNEWRNTQTIGSFAPLLVSNAMNPLNARNEDALDQLKRLERRLPEMLANMPERKPGERDLTIDTLLGPPQPSAGLYLIEVIIYLCSNSLLNGSTLEYNQAMHWIADNVPLQSIGTLLQNNSPTLQAFRFQLLRFGVQTGRESFVKDLLHTDNGLKGFALRSTQLLPEAVKSNNVEMMKLLLKLGLDVLRSEIFESTKGRLLRDCTSISMSKLLSKEVTVPASKASSVKSIGDSALLSAIQRRDIEMVQFLIKAGADVNVFVNDGWGNPKVFFDDDDWSKDLVDERWGRVTALSLAVVSGQTDLLRPLLESNADVHVQAAFYDYLFSDNTLEEYMSFKVMSFVGTALQAAAARSNTDMVRMLLEKGSNINERPQGPKGRTALQAAVESECIDAVRLLLEQGADVNAPATNSRPPRTALITAAESKNLVLTKLLLDFNADVSALALSPDAETLMTVIEAAKAEGGRPDTVRVLEPAGDSGVASFKRIQLCHAIQRGDVEIVRHLINSGACVDTRPVEEICWFQLPGDDDLMGDKYRDRPEPWKVRKMRSVSERATMLHMAITSQTIVDSSMFTYLCQQIDGLREQHSEDNLEPVLHTALEWNLEPFLHTAVRWRRFDLVEFLLESAINVDTWWNYHKGIKVTALNLAAWSDDVEMALQLLENGAAINYDTSTDEELPLQSSLKLDHLPRISQNFKVTRLLLSRGAIVHWPFSGDEDTPLVIAAENGKLDMIRILLEHGAPVNHHWKRNITPLMAATRGRHLEAVKLLLDNGAHANPPAFDHGFYSDRGTALQFAAKDGSFAIAQLLLERGANVNALGPESTIYGRTALETAAMHGRLDMLQLFLNAGADGHLPLKNRYSSALRIAKGDCFEPNFGVVKLLQEYREEALDEWNSARILELDY
jgi:ankyrin repeat protein